MASPDLYVLARRALLDALEDAAVASASCVALVEELVEAVKTRPAGVTVEKCPRLRPIMPSLHGPGSLDAPP